MINSGFFEEIGFDSYDFPSDRTYFVDASVSHYFFFSVFCIKHLAKIAFWIIITCTEGKKKKSIRMLVDFDPLLLFSNNFKF